MMKPILNAMRLQAARQAAGRRETEVGIVTNYDPDNFAVRARLQAAGTITGWLPLASPWVGNGWGLFAAPSLGDMVAVEFFGAHLEAGFVEGRLFNDEDRPLPVPSGEFWLVHATGSALKFTNDGDVLLVTARDLQATVGRNLGATVAGDATLDVSGALDATATTAKISAPTTIEGSLTVNGPTTLNGPLSQGAGGAGGTTAHLIGPVTVDQDLIANGISTSGHAHGLVKAGTDISGGPQ